MSYIGLKGFDNFSDFLLSYSYVVSTVKNVGCIPFYQIRILAFLCSISYAYVINFLQECD